MTPQVRIFIRKNWFRLAMALLLLFIAGKKNLSFQINFRDPARPATELPDQHPTQRESTDDKKQEYLSGKHDPEQANINRLNLQPFRKKDSKREASLSLWPEKTLEISDEEQINTFIKRFAHVAVNERKKFGVPASVLMALALTGSRAGGHPAAEDGHNFFRTPCTPEWKGETIYFQGHCLRKYETAWMSFRDHSLYLTSGRFDGITQLGPTDYQAWAQTLARLDYADHPRFDKLLIDIIETYQLTLLDQEV